MAFNSTEKTQEGTTYVEIELSSNDWMSLSNQFTEVLLFLADKLKKLKPNSWNRLYFEHWPDSGRIIIYPHKRGKPRSSRLLSIDVSSDLLQSEYDKIPPADRDPDLFESFYVALTGRRSKCLRKAFSDERVIEKMEDLASQIDFTAWEQEADDQESLVPIYFV